MESAASEPGIEIIDPESSKQETVDPVEVDEVKLTFTSTTPSKTRRQARSPAVSVFTFCLAAGILAIFVGGLIPPTAGFLRIVVTVFIPLGAMFAYAFLGRGSETNKFADSIYYMGFIFTLLALVSAFILPRMAATAGYMTDTAAMLRSDQLLESFGLALVTTVFGIMVRTLVLQSQVDPFDTVNTYEADMRAYGEEATDQMRSTVDYFRDEAERLRDSFSEQNQAFVAEMNAQTGQVHSALTDEYLGIFKALKAELSAVKDKAASLSDMQSDVSGDIDRVRDRLGDMESTVGKKVDVAVGSLEALERAIDTRIVTAAEAATESLEALASTVEPLRKSSDSMATSATHLTTSSTAMSALGDQIGALQAQIADMERTIVRMSDNLSGSSDAALGELRNVVDNFSSSLAETRRLLQ